MMALVRWRADVEPTARDGGKQAMQASRVAEREFGVLLAQGRRMR